MSASLNTFVADGAASTLLLVTVAMARVNLEGTEIGILKEQNKPNYYFVFSILTYYLSLHTPNLFCFKLIFLFLFYF